MQLAIELPDELGEQLIQHGNVDLFIQEAVQGKLLAEQKMRNLKVLSKAVNKGGRRSVTQSLTGLLKGSELDVNSYHQHLEDKYL